MEYYASNIEKFVSRIVGSEFRIPAAYSREALILKAARSVEHLTMRLVDEAFKISLPALLPM